MKCGRSGAEKAFGVATHVVFGDSAGNTLKRVIRDIGVTPNVLIYPDDLSCGPFGDITAEKRVAWLRNKFGGTKRSWAPMSRQLRQFWKSVDDDSAKFVVWVSRRSAREYSAFLEWVNRSGRSSYEVVDISDARLHEKGPDGRIRRPRVASCSQLEADPRLWIRLFRTARPLARARRQHYIRLWKQLKSEVAMLRTIRGEDLVSAPENFYDEALLKYASPNWERSAVMIGTLLVENSEAGISPVSVQTLFSRVQALVRAGRLEGRGAQSTIGNTEIRLPR